MNRLLFVSEAVTLAQVVRLKTLADTLCPSRYEIHFAASRFDDMIFGGTSFRRWPIRSVSDDWMRMRARRGARIYDERTLSDYVDQERELIRSIRPDLILGDLRWSLAVSAPLERVRYAALINAYWSPDHHDGKFPLPDHPIVDWLGPGVAGLFFPLARPFVFAHHARPLNRLRRRHGLAPIGSLGDILLHGDHTLFPDVPGLVPVSRQSPYEHFLGPVLWSPSTPPPAWWDDDTDLGQVIYVTLGSSGRADRLSVVCEGLSRLGQMLYVATAGNAMVSEGPKRKVASFLPGQLAAKRASLVVCHGGSTTAYQALAEGVPVLGIPTNLDQYLSMRAIERSGAGISLRADRVTATQVALAARELLTERKYREAALRVQREFSSYDTRERFHQFLRDVS